MKLFVVNNVLTDYTDGMIVVRAESIEQAIELCLKDFGGTAGSTALEDETNYTEIDLDGTPSVVDYVYGGA
jgi:hypothetical protein